VFRRRPDPRDEIIASLLKQNADLLDRLQEMIGQIHLHQVEKAQADADYMRKLHVTEEEDDLRFAGREGIVGKDDLERMLQELQFENADLEVEFP